MATYTRNAITLEGSAAIITDYLSKKRISLLTSSKTESNDGFFPICRVRHKRDHFPARHLPSRTVQ